MTRDTRFCRQTDAGYIDIRGKFSRRRQRWIRHLLRERRIGPLRVRSGVLGRLLLRVVGMIGPGFGTMGSAVP